VSAQRERSGAEGARGVRVLLAWGRREIGPDVAGARLDAEVLLAHALGRPRGWLLAHPEAEPPAHATRAYLSLVARRARGEPVAYLTGLREFWSLALEVTPATLIPRPETELLVEACLRRLPADAAWRIADLGTGSGAVALAIARERPSCRVIATDVDAGALAIAGRNVARLGLANVELRRGDWLETLGAAECDVIASNPPYVADADPHLARGDVRFEPRAALAAGADGLAAIRIIVAGAGARLAPGGRLVLEHGYHQGDAVRALLLDAGFSDIETHRDLAGHARVTEAVPGQATP